MRLARRLVGSSQLLIDGIRVGAVRRREGSALLQVRVGNGEFPIRRVELAVGEKAVVDGWMVRLTEVDASGPGAVTVEVEPTG